jgi:tetratricopeptide (TPR) repeat protein
MTVPVMFVPFGIGELLPARPPHLPEDGYTSILARCLLGAGGEHGLSPHMAVLIEATTVVIRTASVERRYPGGVAGLKQHVPNTTYHSDGTLAAISFMDVRDARLFVATLSKHGLSDPWCSRSEDVAVVDERQGFLAESDWLQVDLQQFSNNDGTSFGATIAWIGDEDPATFAFPDGWYPRRIVEQFSLEELKQNYEVVKIDRDEASGAAVTAYRHRVTGQTLYTARTAPLGYKELRMRYDALTQELSRLFGMPDSPQRAAAAATLYESVTELIKQMQPTSASLFIQGLAARFAQQWSNAEAVFRRITELWPDNRDAWLELTWALSSLGRVDEAETAARRAVAIDDTCAAAHANLASVLLQQGRPGEALPAIERSLELDPSETTSQIIRAQVQQALGHEPAQSAARVPTVFAMNRWMRWWLSVVLLRGISLFGGAVHRFQYIPETTLLNELVTAGFHWIVFSIALLALGYFIACLRRRFQRQRTS